jgi:UDP-N-acetylmuramoyl-tripeptide--D-alanyl-D-alanine ligase
MTGGSLYRSGLEERRFSGVSIDSRTLQRGQLFIAIRGERVDGHDYITEAIRKGAAGLITEYRFAGLEQIDVETPVVVVEDCHDAMIRLAAEYRNTMNARFVGITGSNGKTTTKETTFSMLAAVEKDVYRSAGNLNNLYGMPLALLALPASSKVAVIEMGISTFGEMTRLTKVVKPNVGLFTNIGATHLEFLGSLEGVARAKFEMVEAGSSDMTVIINADDPVLVAEARKHARPIVTFAVQNPATFTAEKVEVRSDGASIVTVEGHRFRSNLFGRHQVYNLLAAYAVARTLGYSYDGVATEEIQFTSAPMRGEIVSYGGVHFVADCYNANPDSVRLGLESLSQVPGSGRRLIILGDMLELGECAEEYHRQIGRQLAGIKFDFAALVGPQAAHMLEAARQAGVSGNRLAHFADAASCAQRMVSVIQPGDLVYVKGSRGIGLEVVLRQFREAEVKA